GHTGQERGDIQGSFQQRPKSTLYVPAYTVPVCPRVHRPVLVQPAPDLDRDGTPDLVWASPGHPSLVAISGRTGKFLWGFIGKDPEGKPPPGLLILGRPLAADVKGEGAPAILAVFAIQEGGRVALWIEAVSGRDGTSLWR